MPRPAKPKTVCKAEDFLYGCRRYPKTLNMSHEELETIRLIDMEKFTQEETANHMNVSRATVQALYEQARETLAYAIVEQHTILVCGGNYKLCEDHDYKEKRGCRRYQNHEHAPKHKKEMENINEEV